MDCSSKTESIYGWLEALDDDHMPGQTNNPHFRSAGSLKRSLPSSLDDHSGTAGRGKGKKAAHLGEAETSVPYAAASDTRASSSSKTTRVQLGLLAFASPSIEIQPYGSKDEKPDVFRILFQELLQSKDREMPAAFIDLVKTNYPPEEALFLSTAPSSSDIDVSGAFTAISKAYDAATEAHSVVGDEATWSESLRIMLENGFSTPAGQNGESLLELTQVSKVSIGPESLLPRSNGHAIPFKKVGFLAAFSNDNREIRTLIRTVRKRHRGLLLSPTEDPAVGGQCQFFAVEAQSPDGGYYSSILQLSTWLAASLEKLRQLRELAASVLTAEQKAVPLLPMIGISVVGHSWFLHIACKAENGEVTVYSPMNMGDTLSIKAVVQISNVLDRVEQWGIHTYWPWLRDEILKPLSEATPELIIENVTGSSGLQVEYSG